WIPRLSGLIRACGYGGGLRLFAQKRLALTPGIGFKDSLDFMAAASEGVDFGFPRAHRLGWVFKTPVIAVDLAGKQGTAFVRVITHGDHCINARRHTLVEVLGRVT